MTVVDVHCHVAPESCLPMEVVGSDGLMASASIGTIAGPFVQSPSQPQLRSRPALRYGTAASRNACRRGRYPSAESGDFFYNPPDEECAERSRLSSRDVRIVFGGWR